MLEQVTCASCRRYIGPMETCPYCRTRNPKRYSTRALRWGSLLAALVLLLAVHQYAVRSDVPLLKAGDIGPANNLGYVRVEGMVVAGPVFYRNDDEGRNSLRFDIDDGTGVVTVRTYETTAEGLLKGGRWPSYGDTVKVAGTLRFRENSFYMILASPSALSYQRPPARNISIDDLATGSDTFRDGERVRVTGWVVSANETGGGLSIQVGGSGEGTAPVQVSRSLFEISAYLGDGEAARVREFASEKAVSRWRVLADGALHLHEGGTSRYWEVFPATLGDVKRVDAGGG